MTTTEADASLVLSASRNEAYQAFCTSAEAMKQYDLPPAVTKLVGHLTTLVDGVEQKLKCIETSQEENGRVFGEKLREIEDKMRNVSKELGLKFPEKEAETGAKKAPEPQSESVEDPITVPEDTRETSFVFLGQKQPLCMSYEFSLYVGDFCFDSFYQSLHFIKFRYLEQDALAWKVKGTTSVAAIDSFGNSVNEEGQEKWCEVVEKVAMALLREKARQAPEFKDVLVTSRSDAKFFQCGENQYFTTGVGWAVAVSQLKNREEHPNFPGQNLMGRWLSQLREELWKDEKVEKDFFDVAKYCRFEAAKVEEGGKVLVISDSRTLEGVQGRGRTAFFNYPGVGLLGDSPQSLSKILISAEGQEKKQIALDFSQARAILLLIGTAYLSRDENEFETKLLELISFIRSATNVPLFLANLVPRPDTLGTHVKLVNFALRIAVRTCGTADVFLLDLYDRFANDPHSRWQSFYMRSPSANFNTTGWIKYIETLAELFPVANLAVDTCSELKRAQLGKGNSAKKGKE